MRSPDLAGSPAQLLSYGPESSRKKGQNLEDPVPALDTCEPGKLYFTGLKWSFARRISPSFFSQPSASSSSPTVAFWRLRSFHRAVDVQTCRFQPRSFGQCRKI